MTGLDLLLIVAVAALPFVVRTARAARYEPQLASAKQVVAVEQPALRK